MVIKHRKHIPVLKETKSYLITNVQPTNLQDNTNTDHMGLGTRTDSLTHFVTENENISFLHRRNIVRDIKIKAQLSDLPTSTADPTA